MIFSKKKSVNTRIDANLYNALDEVMKIRIQKGLANPRKKDEISLREMSELLTRTDGFKMSLFELKTKPKKKNGK